MPPNASLIFFAFFESPDCQLPGDGRGDHVLGSGRSAGNGTYSASLTWGDVFKPATGRDIPRDFPLPTGRYDILVVPCPSEDVGACSRILATGSGLGPVFEFKAG